MPSRRALLDERTFKPDVKNAGAYAERFALYREVYPTLKDLAHRM